MLLLVESHVCGTLCENDTSGVGAGWDLEFGYGSHGRAGQGCREESVKWGEPWRGVDRRRGCLAVTGLLLAI